MGFCVTHCDGIQRLCSNLSPNQLTESSYFDSHSSSSKSSKRMFTKLDFINSWQSVWDLPAMMAVDLYSGLKGQRPRPSSVIISSASLLAREKSAVFWGTHTQNVTRAAERQTCNLLWLSPLPVCPTARRQSVSVRAGLKRRSSLYVCYGSLQKVLKDLPIRSANCVDSLIIWLHALNIFLHFPLARELIK